MCSVRLRVHSHSHSLLERPRPGVWYGGERACCKAWHCRASFRVPSRCGSKGCRVVLLSLLEDQRARAPVKDASEACTVQQRNSAFFLRTACTTPMPYEVSVGLQNIPWLNSKNGSSMMRRTRSLVHAAVRSYSPSSSLRLASVGGPVNACDTFHVHAR